MSQQYSAISAYAPVLSCNETVGNGALCGVLDQEGFKFCQGAY